MNQKFITAVSEMADKHDSVLVAYSDGKDSRVVMDLCIRFFRRVEAFHMTFIPGLECVRRGLIEAQERWGVPIREYPHWILSRLLRDGVYCHPSWRFDDLPEVKVTDVYAVALVDARCSIVATGAKESDSPWRRRFMSTTKKNVFQPLQKWHKYDVLGYLKERGIPLPPSSGKQATGIDLSPPSLLWLHDTYPDDFARVQHYFPFVEAVVWRRKFYGE